jgi:hypothetical protein
MGSGGAVSTIIKPLDHPYAKVLGREGEPVRRAFEDARLKARMGHDRTDCPHDGLPSKRDNPKTNERRKFLRKVWLIGYELEKEAMEREEEEARAPKPDPVKIKWRESATPGKRYRRGPAEPQQDAAQAPRKAEAMPTMQELEAIAARRLRGKGAR